MSSVLIAYSLYFSCTRLMPATPWSPDLRTRHHEPFARTPGPHEAPFLPWRPTVRPVHPPGLLQPRLLWPLASGPTAAPWPWPWPASPGGALTTSAFRRSLRGSGGRGHVRRGPMQRVAPAPGHFPPCTVDRRRSGVFSAARFYMVAWLGERSRPTCARRSTGTSCTRVRHFPAGQTGEEFAVELSADTHAESRRWGRIEKSYRLGLRNRHGPGIALAMLVWTNQVAGHGAGRAPGRAGHPGWRSPVRKLSRDSQDRIADASAVADRCCMASRSCRRHPQTDEAAVQPLNQRALVPDGLRRAAGARAAQVAF